jgi:hypothetical protein
MIVPGGPLPADKSSGKGCAFAQPESATQSDAITIWIFMGLFQ